MQSTHRKKYLNNLVKLIQLADTFQNKKMKLRILNNIEADVREKIAKTSDEQRVLSEDKKQNK
jgi:hypothetical protein|tara:strand:- start:4 stop:192 length:189 start_codon:yes stop_codon:yes gene_type:complete